MHLGGTRALRSERRRRSGEERHASFLRFRTNGAMGSAELGEDLGCGDEVAAEVEEAVLEFGVLEVPLLVEGVPGGGDGNLLGEHPGVDMARAEAEAAEGVHSAHGSAGNRDQGDGFGTEFGRGEPVESILEDAGASSMVFGASPEKAVGGGGEALEALDFRKERILVEFAVERQVHVVAREEFAGAARSFDAADGDLEGLEGGGFGPQGPAKGKDLHSVSVPGGAAGGEEDANGRTCLGSGIASLGHKDRQKPLSRL